MFPALVVRPPGEPPGCTPDVVERGLEAVVWPPGVVVWPPGPVVLGCTLEVVVRAPDVVGWGLDVVGCRLDVVVRGADVEGRGLEAAGRAAGADRAGAGAEAWGAGAEGRLSAQAKRVAEDANNSATAAALILRDEPSLQYPSMLIIISFSSCGKYSRTAPIASFSTSETFSTEERCFYAIVDVDVCTPSLPIFPGWPGLAFRAERKRLPGRDMGSIDGRVNS